MNFIDKIRNMITKSEDDSHEFKPILAEIEDSPLNPLGNTIFWLIISFMAIGSLWMYFGRVDVVITARGIVIPDGETKTIQPLDKGVIADIFVKEGDYAEKGQVLIEIDPASTEPQLESVQKNLEDTMLEIKRLNAEASGAAFNAENSDSGTAKIQQDIYNAGLSALKNKIEVKRLEMSKTQDELNAAKAEKAAKQEILASLTAQADRMKSVLDIITRDEYEKVLNDIKSEKAEISSLDYKISRLNLHKVQINKEKASIEDEFKTKNLERLTDKTKAANELKAGAGQIIFRNTKQTIISPCSGWVDKMFVHTKGGVVTPAEKLMTIVPKDAKLLIKAQVSNQDIGFAAEGMPVTIKVDTYNFQKYGTLKGRVKSISPNSVKDEKTGDVFEVYIEPEQTILLVEGKEQPLKFGMTTVNEIKIGKRRIIEFFIYPLIKYMDESIKVR